MGMSLTDRLLTSHDGGGSNIVGVIGVTSLADGNHVIIDPDGLGVVFGAGSSFPSGLPALGLVVGGVLFGSASGGIGQDVSKLFWDDTNNMLGIGTAAPGAPLHVTRPTDGTAVIAENTFAGFTGILQVLRTTRAANSAFLLLQGICNGVEQFDIDGRGAYTQSGTAPNSFAGTMASAGFLVGATAGIDAAITSGGLVGKTITVTKGIITGFA